MHYGLTQHDTNFYVWFGSFINKENPFQSFPLYYMALGRPFDTESCSNIVDD